MIDDVDSIVEDSRTLVQTFSRQSSRDEVSVYEVMSIPGAKQLEVLFSDTCSMENEVFSVMTNACTFCLWF